MIKIFDGLTPELASALEIIKAECEKHEKSCKNCPLWHNNGTVAQACGVNVYDGRFSAYPCDWEIKGGK